MLHKAASTRVHNFIPGYTVSYLGTQFHAWIHRAWRHNFTTRWKKFYQRSKFHTREHNFLPRCKKVYLSSKFHTCQWNYIPRYETTYSGRQVTDLSDRKMFRLNKSYRWLFVAFAFVIFYESVSRNGIQLNQNSCTTLSIGASSSIRQ
jgi:hypothetical protein